MTPEYDMPIPHPDGLFYARGPIGQVYYHDALTGEARTNSPADQQDYIMVQQELEHTYNHFREICSSKTFNGAPREIWQEKGSKDLIDRVRDEYQNLREKHQPINHPEEVLKELDAIVARASKELAG